MKRLVLRNSLLLIVLLFSACGDDDCLDIERLDQLSATAKQWYVDPALGNRNLIDSNGVNQTLVVANTTEHTVPDAVEDDCGNIYGSFDYTVSFIPSLSPIIFEIDINGSGISEDEFYLKMIIYMNGTEKTARYDFAGQSSHDNHAVITILDEWQVLNHTYQHVMLFNFNNSQVPGDIEKIYYAQDFGIIEYIDHSGVAYQVEWQ